MTERTRRTRRSPAVLLRSTVAGAPLLIRRRARRDGPLLAVWTLTVAFAALLAVVGPNHLARTVDAGAREAVASAGSDADLVIETPVSGPNRMLQLAAVPPSTVIDVAEEVQARFPESLGRTLDATTVAATGSRTVIAPEDVEPALADPSLRMRMTMALLTEQNVAALELAYGALPVDRTPPAGTPDAVGVTPIEIVLSEQGAAVTSLGIGSVISLPSVNASTGAETVIEATVVGLVADHDGGQRSPWRDAPEVWSPTVLNDRGSIIAGVTVLAPPGAVSEVIRARGAPFDGTIRYSFDPSEFTADLLTSVAAESRRLTANNSALVAGSGYDFDVTFGFGPAVADFPERVRATLAELSIVISGVVGTAAAVLLLVARLIVARRLPDALLERARGASLAAIGVRTLLGAISSIAVAMLIVIGVGRVAGLGIPADLAPVLTVLAVALVAGTIQTIASIRSRSTASMVGVNRRDTVRRRHRRRIARIAAEATIVVLAVFALVALLDRGLLQRRSYDIDPLIAAAPLLLAVAVTVLVLRVVPLPIRAAAIATSRSRGVSGPIVSSRLLRGIPVAPLAAVTVAVALVTGTGLIGLTVHDGQEDASWQRIGADTRVDGPVDEEDVEQVASAVGVSAASAIDTRAGLQLDLGTSRSGVTLLAVDRGYPGLISGLPDIGGVTDASDAEQFALLSDALTDDAPLPVVVDAVVADRLISDDLSVAIGDADVPLRVVGTVGSGPVGYLDGPLVYVDLAALTSRLSTPSGVDTLLVIGPGAAAAVERVEPEASAVVTRAGWLDDRRDLALVAGVRQAVTVSAVVLAALALAAIVCTALAGSAERARHLALLRTLGVRPRFGILLAAIDQVPLLIASLIGGVLAGVGIAVLLTPALGLEFLTGGVATPEPSLSPPFLLAVLAGLVVVFALGTLIEILIRRRDRVSDTIRLGETV